MLLGHPAADTLAWEPLALLAGLAATVPMLVMFGVFRTWDIGPLRRVGDRLDELVAALFVQRSVGEIALVSIVAGVGEELLFRGLLQGMLHQYLGVVTALVVASIVFGLAHPITPTYSLLAALFGGYLGWLWLVTGNLLAPMAAHAGYDFAALLLLVRRARAAAAGAAQLSTDSSEPPADSPPSSDTTERRSA